MPKLETAMADVHLQSAAGDDGGCESPNTGASENAGRAEVAREVVVSNNKRTAVDCASRPLSPPSGPPEAIRDVHSSCASTPATRAPLTAASLIRAPCPPGSPPAPSSKELSAFEGPDWTADLPDSEQVRRFRSFDWPARTSLGDLRSWSIAARIHVFTLFADSRPACLYWGPARYTIYNDAFISLVGSEHPRIFGMPFELAYPEIWDTINGVFAQVESTGVAANVEEMPLFVKRSGLFSEEAIFTGNFTPMRGGSGTVLGFYNAVHEVTAQTLHRRRAAMLNRMPIPSGLHTGDFGSYVIPSLATNDIDIPMALLYDCDEETLPGSCLLNLRGQFGFPQCHPLAVEQADLNSLVGLMPAFRKAGSDITSNLIDERFDGIEWKGFKDPCTHFFVLPLQGAGRIFGYLMLGCNPRRPIDDAWVQFMIDVRMKVTSIAAAMASAEETRKRAERLERELADSERQIRYMAEHASVGMQHLALDGTTIWSNKQYCKLTGHPTPHEDQYKFSFLDVIIDEDRPKALASWESLIKGGGKNEAELRLKRTFTPPSGDPEPIHMLSSSFPYCENGVVKSIMCCTTDISQLKWAEEIEARNAQEARDAKRQQEEFIDIVSHEMRNPLSAIFQCADLIVTSLAEVKVAQCSTESLLEALRSNVEAANTIMICSNHQKRIVDDVLTLSKMEYMMLSLFPQVVQPHALVQRIVRMFQADLEAHGITVSVVTDPSVKKNGIHSAMFDPNRVTQVFINLLTNAIKFTQAARTKKITIRWGAVFSEPRKAFPSAIHWAPMPDEAENTDLTLDPEWGSGETVYLTCSVQDTGAGMKAEEIPRLFSRFQQANEKTSIKYGGTGLGLFISARLIEKQGGEIGVASRDGVGSTFVFYLKSKLAVTEATDSLTNEPHKRPRPGINNTDAMHVLLVEDNVVNQQVLKKQLLKAGCVVLVANHGLEALEVLRRTTSWHETNEESVQLDIILMDWEMPVMDGLTCAREIRALQEAGKVVEHIEIIGITANAREEQILAAISNGIDEVVSKPFRAQDLLSRMRSRLSNRSYGPVNQSAQLSP